MNPNIGCPTGVTVTQEFYSKIELEKGKGWLTIPLPKLEALDGQPIVGLYVRKQSEGEKKKTAPFTDTPLVSNNALVNAFVNIKSNKCDQFLCVPLEHFLFDCKYHSPGAFKKLYFGQGIDWSQSSIVINTNCLDADLECLMMHWIGTNVEAQRFVSNCS